VIHPYNNQILVGRQGQGGVTARRLSSVAGSIDDASRLVPMFPTNGLTTEAPPSIATSVTLHLQQKMRSAVSRAAGMVLWEAHWGGESVTLWRLFIVRVDEDVQRL
jgi:hypothetical protein